VTWVRSGVLGTATWVTLQEAFTGFVLGSTSGIVLGFGLGASRVLAAVFAPMVTALYTVPKLALIPMFILWFGIGTESKVAMVTLIVFFYAFFTSYGGATQVDEELIAVTRMMGASRWQVLQKVTFPSAMAWVILGLQISVPHAFTGAIVAEMVAGQHGLGQLIRDAAGQFNANGLFAGILAAVVLSGAANGVVALGSRYALRWRSTNEQETGAAAIA
jgi:NitT/TauT family transport system permease protein